MCSRWMASVWYLHIFRGFNFVNLIFYEFWQGFIFANQTWEKVKVDLKYMKRNFTLYYKETNMNKNEVFRRSIFESSKNLFLGTKSFQIFRKRFYFRIRSKNSQNLRKFVYLCHLYHEIKILHEKYHLKVLSLKVL